MTSLLALRPALTQGCPTLSNQCWTREKTVVARFVQGGQRGRPFLPIPLKERRGGAAPSGTASDMFFLPVFNLGWTGWTGWTEPGKSSTSRVEPNGLRPDGLDG